MKHKKKFLAVGLSVVVAATALACNEERDRAYDSVAHKAAKRSPYIPKNGVEYNNYINAQKTYDDPASIIWCTTTWGNASAPLVTIPVAGKLTSSSVSIFSGTHGDGSERVSVDGMYHGNPPPYRFGFTPGGQYVDFFNMPTICTTALTKFQRQSTEVNMSVDTAIQDAQRRAQEALKAGNHKKAEQILDDALGSN